MTTDFRALCAELLAAADEYAGMNPYMRLDNAMKTARAALAVEPDVDRILSLAAIIREVDGRHDKSAAALAEAILLHPNARAALAAEQEPPATAFVVATDKELLEFAGERFPYALRSCYDLGRQHGATLAVEPEPVADGEVAELVAWMRNQCTLHSAAQTQWAKRFLRAADLLERLAESEPTTSEND